MSGFNGGNWVLIAANDRVSYGSHMVVARTISNATTHPGKTFYGCSCRFEMLDKGGAPL